MGEKMIPPEPEQIKAMEPGELFKQYERLVKKIAYRFKGSAARYGWIGVDDLEQIAALALLKAQKAFDPAQETSFLSFACTIMEWEIMKGLKIRRRPDGRFTGGEIVLSLDETIDEEGETTRGELIPDNGTPIDEQIEREETAAQVRAAVDTLPPEQNEIIEKVYLSDPAETRLQIAERQGVTAQAVTQREEKAFKKLRRQLWELYIDCWPRHIGVRQFNTTFTSEPEQYVIMREKRYIESQNRIKNYLEAQRAENGQKGKTQNENSAEQDHGSPE